MSRQTSPVAFGKVAVLYGGDSGERAVSLDSGQAVHAALLARGIDAHLFDPSRQPINALREQGVDRVWNALHGGSGENGAIQGALILLDIPATGSGVLGCALAMDKVRSKQLLAANEIPVPTGLTVARGDLPPETLSYPVFVKPANGGSSLGSQPAQDAATLIDALASAHAHDELAMIEPLLSGPEYTVPVLHGAALPAIRIEVQSAFYDYDAKYLSDATRYLCPAMDADAPLAKTLANRALRSFSTLGCHGWGRVDFMVDGAGEPLVLEVNTVPGMTGHSLVPRSAAVAGIDFEELCWRVLETSFENSDSRGVANG